MSLVLEAIAADVAALSRVVPTPTEPLGYGVDLSCVTDITEALDEVDAFSAVGIVEALCRRLGTPRGGLPDDPDYGLDVRGMLNRATDAETLRDLQGQIRNECTKDDRVEAVDVTVSVTFAPTTLSIKLVITPADPELGPFSATLAVTDAGLLLEAIG